MIGQAMPFLEAIEYILERVPIPFGDWNPEDFPPEMLEVDKRAFFMSNVENMRFIDRVQSFLFDHLAGTLEEIPQPDGTTKTALRAGGRDHFIRAMREFMIEEGMVTGEDEFWDVNQNDIRDIRSEARLRLILDTNIRQAYGYGQWKQGQKPHILYRFPAARFVRDREVEIKRPRHAKSEGQVRLKNDYDWWAKYQNGADIGGFEVPWAPFGFNSGMGMRDVSREDSIELGLDVNLVTPDETKKLNTNTRASTLGISEEAKRKAIEEMRNYKPKISFEEGLERARMTVYQDGELIVME